MQRVVVLGRTYRIFSEVIDKNLIRAGPPGARSNLVRYVFIKPSNDVYYNRFRIHNIIVNCCCNLDRSIVVYYV